MISYTKTNLPTITSTQAKLLSEKTTPENSRSSCFKRHCSILNMKCRYFLSPLKLQNDCLSCVNQSSTKPFQAVHAGGCFCDKILTTLSSHSLKIYIREFPHFERLCAEAGWGVGVGERGLCRNVGSYKKRWQECGPPLSRFSASDCGRIVRRQERGWRWGSKPGVHLPGITTLQHTRCCEINQYPLNSG